MDSSRKKKRCLNYDKCLFCRQDKKKCEPTDRTWPGQKCSRCAEMNLPCSENQRKRRRRLGLPEAQSTLSSSPRSPSAQDEASGTTVAENGEWSVDSPGNIWNRKTYWLQHLKRVAISITDNNYDLDGAFEDLLCDVNFTIRRLVFDLVDTMSPLEFDPEKPSMRQTAEMIKSIVSTQDLDTGMLSHLRYSAGLGPPGLRRLTERLTTAGLLDSAIQVQEYLLLLSSTPVISTTERAEAQDDLKKYQAIHKLLFQDYGKHSSWEHPLPEDHLPFLAHNQSLINLAISCGSFEKSTDILGRSLIHLALACKGVNALNLITTSPMIEYRDLSGVAPIHLACTYGNFEAVQALLNRGVKLDYGIEANNWRPWHCAAFSGNTRVMQRVLDAMQTEGLDVDSTTHGRPTALSLAAKQGHEAVVRLLLGCGADPTLTDKEEGWNCLHHAVEGNSFSVVKLLVEQHGLVLNVPGIYYSRRTPLQLACDNREVCGDDNSRIIFCLLSHPSTDINERDWLGNTALHLAVGAENEDALNILVNVGGRHLSVDLKNDAGETPLFIAAKNGHEEIVAKMLSSKRVRVSEENNKGDTPLSVAIKRGHVGVAQLIQRHLEPARSVHSVSVPPYQVPMEGVISGPGIFPPAFNTTTWYPPSEDETRTILEHMDVDGLLSSH